MVCRNRILPLQLRDGGRGGHHLVLPHEPALPDPQPVPERRPAGGDRARLPRARRPRHRAVRLLQDARAAPRGAPGVVLRFRGGRAPALQRHRRHLRLRRVPAAPLHRDPARGAGKLPGGRHLLQHVRLPDQGLFQRRARHLQLPGLPEGVPGLLRPRPAPGPGLEDGRNLRRLQGAGGGRPAAAHPPRGQGHQSGGRHLHLPPQGRGHHPRGVQLRRGPAPALLPLFRVGELPERCGLLGRGEDHAQLRHQRGGHLLPLPGRLPGADQDPPLREHGRRVPARLLHHRGLCGLPGPRGRRGHARGLRRPRPERGALRQVPVPGARAALPAAQGRPRVPGLVQPAQGGARPLRCGGPPRGRRAPGARGGLCRADRAGPGARAGGHAPRRARGRGKAPVLRPGGRRGHGGPAPARRRVEDHAARHARRLPLHGGQDALPLLPGPRLGDPGPGVRRLLRRAGRAAPGAQRHVRPAGAVLWPRDGRGVRPAAQRGRDERGLCLPARAALPRLWLRGPPAARAGRAAGPCAGGLFAPDERAHLRGGLLERPAGRPDVPAAAQPLGL